MDIQQIIRQSQQENFDRRSQTQMTLGKLIKRLKELPKDLLVEGLECPHSYRGYYSDFALERRSEKIKAKKLLRICKESMGQVFEGYKGGDFIMYAHTPVWIADYGDCGVKLMEITDEGKVITQEDTY